MLDASSGVEVSLMNCTFDNNTIIPSDHGSAVIQADAGGTMNDTAVWLPRFKFESNTLVQNQSGLNANSTLCMHAGVAAGVYLQWQHA